jgi:putative membrane protein
VTAPDPDRPSAPADRDDAAAEAAWAERPLDPRDYSRRTHLANERTYLAWWRTGLTALAASLAAARVVPELSGADERWPYTLLGVACALAGVLAIGYGHRRRLEVEDGLRRGTFPPVSRLVTGAITALGLLIGLGLLVLIVVDG